MEPSKVYVASIHDVEAALLERDLVEDIDVVQLAVREMDEGWDAAAQIE